MNQSCLTLLLLLLVYNDDERVFTNASPSWLCKSDYCINEQTPTTPGDLNAQHHLLIVKLNPLKPTVAIWVQL